MRTFFLAAAVAASYPAWANDAQLHLIYPTETPVILNAEDALRLAQSRFPHTETLVHRYTRTSLLGTHYNFVQHNSADQPCVGALVVTTDQQGQLYRIFYNLIDDPDGCELNLPLPPRAHQLVAPPTGEPVTASMRVFDPDPRTATGQALEAQASSSADEKSQGNLEGIAIPAHAYHQADGVEVTRRDGRLYLANSRVIAVDLTELAGEAQTPLQGLISVTENEDFLFNREQAAFRDVNAFFHLDHSLQYLNQLGFSGERALFSAPLKVDAQGESGNSSTYLTDIGVLTMGIGGIPDSEDADIVLHELGHAINHQLVPDWKDGDSDGMGEGFGDYWAGAYSFWAQRDRADKFELDVFANWDGLSGVLKSQRSLNDQEARYFPAFDYRAHVSVMGTLSDQLWSTPLFQTLKQAVAQYGEPAFDEFNRIVLEGMAGMGYGVKMYDLAQSTVDAANRLYPEKAYARLLSAQFQYHQILQDDVVVAQRSTLLSSEEGHTAVLPVSLANVSGQPLVNYRAELSLPSLGWRQVIEREHIPTDASEALALDIPLPVGLQCGSPLVLDADIRVSKNADQQPLNLHQQLSFIYGQPVFALPLQTLNRPLTDARLSAQHDKLLLGEDFFVMTVPMTVPGESSVVDDHFAIYLDLAHPQFADLKVVVRTPSGRSLTLLDYQHKPVAQHEQLFTLANTPELENWLGEPLSGNWTLEVTDRVAGHQGQIHRWGIGPVTTFRCPEADKKESKEPTPAVSGSSGGSVGLYSLLAGLVLAGVRRKARHHR